MVRSALAAGVGAAVLASGAGATESSLAFLRTELDALHHREPRISSRPPLSTFAEFIEVRDAGSHVPYAPAEGSQNTALVHAGARYPFSGRTIAAPTWLKYLTLTLAIKSLCIMVSLICQASPWRVIQKIRMEKDTGSLNPLPLICMTFCAAQWCFYATFAWYLTGNRGFLTIVYANVLGMVLGFYYTMTFHFNCVSSDMWQKMRCYYQCVAAMVLLELGTILMQPSKDSLFFTGMFAACLSMLVGFSPYVTIGEVLKTGKLDSLPVDMILVGEVGCLLWLTCGILIADKWIVYTNVMGLVSNTGIFAVIIRFHPAARSLLGYAKAEEQQLAVQALPPRTPSYGTGGPEERSDSEPSSPREGEEEPDAPASGSRKLGISEAPPLAPHLGYASSSAGTGES